MERPKCPNCKNRVKNKKDHVIGWLHNETVYTCNGRLRKASRVRRNQALPTRPEEDHTGAYMGITYEKPKVR